MPYKDKDKEREFRRKQMARRRAKNPEHYRETMRRSYAKHRDRRLADSKKWREQSPSRNRASYLVSGAKKRSIQKGIEFNLTFEWALEKIERGFCEATGMPFTVSAPTDAKDRSPYAPSIDKIDPSKGYTTDNCRMVVWLYNAAKSEFTDDCVKAMAIAIVEKIAPGIADALKRR